MKTTRYFLKIIAFASLTCGLGFVGEPAKESAQGDRDQTDRTHSLSHNDGAALTKSRPASPINVQIKHTSGENKSYEVRLNKMQNYHAQPAKWAVGSGATATRRDILRSPSTTTVAIGGATAPNAKNSTAAVDGAGIKRKP
jgi:hypothetical protein